VRESQAGNADAVGREAVKHECVIGIWAVGDTDFANRGSGEC